MPSPYSKPLIVVGFILLSHACYSAYEHSLSSHPSSNTINTKSSQSPIETTLPTDISLETLIAVILICLGLIVGGEDLKPVSWRVWAGEVEKETGGGGPFQGLEERINFVNIRAKRKEFADWVRTQKDNGKG